MDKNIEKLCKNLDLIEEKIIVLQEKQQNLESLQNLMELSTEAKLSITALKNELDENLVTLKKHYKTLKKQMEYQQLLILNLMEKVDQLQVKQVAPRIALHPIADSQNVNPNTKSTIMAENTPLRMKITDYENSPFISRRKPVQLQFLDFEAHISVEDFAAIPSYMKGRESLDELRSFLEQTLITCFTDKYTLMCKKRDAVRNPHDIEMWKVYNQQKGDFPHKYFITEGDLSRKLGKLVDKKINNKLQMLRHLNIIKEMRKVKTIYYIWNVASE
uniref:SKA complex subunit 1 n=1 Tax=Culicoides sonorensis TaxID=179676 RepID=A0A336LWC8_CULSO